METGISIFTMSFTAALQGFRCPKPRVVNTQNRFFIPSLNMLLVCGIALLIVEGYEKFGSLPTFLFVLTSCHRAFGRGSPTKFEMKMLHLLCGSTSKRAEIVFFL